MRGRQLHQVWAVVMLPTALLFAFATRAGSLAEDSEGGGTWVRVERDTDASVAEVARVLESPSSWSEVFEEVESASRADLEGRRFAATLRTAAADHPHTLELEPRLDEQGRRVVSFSFADDDHPVAFEGCFLLSEGPEGTRIILEVRVVRWGLLTLIPDALVAQQVRGFVVGLLDDLSRGSRAR